MQRLRTRLRASASRGAPAALSLDFLSASGALDPRITFSRGSNATLTDSTGKITYAPTNLVTNSEAFDNAAWQKVGAGTGITPTVTANAAVAPDGTTTADQIVFNRGAGNVLADISYISQTVTVANGTPYFGTVYLKAATAGDVGKQLAFRHAGSSSYLIITLTANWQRAQRLETSISTSAVFEIANRGTITADSTVTALVWGAQLSPVTYQTTPGTYNSTTPKNLLGFTQEFDNAAWTKTNAYVQTNLLTYSEAFDNAIWQKVAAGTGTAPTVTANSGAAPNGATVADRVQFNLNGGTTTSDWSSFYQFLTISSGVSYTYSVWLKSNDSNSYVVLARDDAGSGAAAVLWTITPQWQRFSYTATSTSTNSSGLRLWLRGGLGTSATADILVWGAQLVQGSTAGDYQRTDAAAAAVQYYAPDGSRTADKLASGAAAGGYLVTATAAVVSGTRYNGSVYVKAAEIGFAFVLLAGSGFTTAGVSVNLSTGAVSTAIGSPLSAQSVDAGGGWWRVSFNLDAVASANGSLNVYLSSDGIWANRANAIAIGSGIYIWGAQLSDSASLDPYVYNPAAAAASTAYYGPRFDYDPLTLAAKGLLIEEQRTNLLLRSQEFDVSAAWNIGTNTVTANVIASPDGSANADLFTATATGIGAFLRQQATLAATTTYTVSTFFKKGTADFANITVFDSTDGNRYWFNLNTGAIASTALVGAGYTNASARIENYGNGWFRCIVTFTTKSSTAFSLFATFTDADASLTVTNGKTGYIYGAQLEAGSFATSYIPTVASQVTRSADVATMIGDNFKSWYNLNAGTFTVDVDSATTGYRTNLQVDDGTLNNRILIQTNNVATAQQYYVVVGGSAVVNTSAQSYSPSGSKTSAAYALNDYAYSVNGATPTADASATVPVVNRLFLGTEVSSNFLNGHIRSLGYYNTRQPNATLQTLTNPSTTPSLALNFISDTYTVGA